MFLLVLKWLSLVQPRTLLLGIGNLIEVWRMTEKEMAEMVKIWNKFKWLVHDRFEWPDLICTYASEGAGMDRRGRSCEEIPKLAMMAMVLFLTYKHFPKFIMLIYLQRS